MKKLLVILVLGVFASCGNGISASDASKDSLKAVDSTANAQKENIDSSAKAQKNTIDSVKQLTNAQIDSEAAAKKDSLKSK
jgi:uncharacterized protein (UPF0333 family)